jgi:aminopeptidase N
VPKNFVVGATGTLQRTQDQGELKTESYHADDVIDFAWTASPHYKTATRRAGDVDITLLYQPENQQYVERYLKATEQALSAYGEWYYPYPYPRITVVDPPSAASGAGGMEYPMLVTGGVGAIGIPDANAPGITVREAETVVLHEMGHQWFYATVATNEAEEPWLDEGFTDFSTVEAATRYYGLKTSMIDAGGAGLGYRDMRRLEYLAMPRVPTYGKAWNFSSLEYGVAAYSKPDIVLATLKNILGAETFGRVMKTYAQRYRFKHPRTEDFVAVAQEVSGQNLKWFFDQAVYGRGVLDDAVESANTRRADGGTYHSEVVLVRKGEVKFPMDVLVAFGDGTTQRQVWDGQAISQTLTFDTSAPLAYAALDPDKKFAMELDTVDNSLTVQPEVAPLMRFASRWLFWMQAILDFAF